MPAAPQWYESDDSALLTGLTFAPTNGTVTAAQTAHLWNDKAGTLSADTATELRITALSRVSGGTTGFSFDHEAARYGWVEVRAVGSGGTGAPAAHVTPWTKVGKGRTLDLRDLPSDGYRTIECRLRVPAGAGDVHYEVSLRAQAAEVVEGLETGHYEGGAQGVESGLGDELASWIVSGGAVTANGPANDKVDVATVVWIHEGIPQTKVAHEVTLSQNDGDAAALGSGEAYAAVLSLGAGTGVTTTKGSKATAPLTVDDIPAVPDGELLLAVVTVDYDAGGGAIATADIDQDDRLFGGFLIETDAASLSVTVHPGAALVGNCRARRTRSTSVAMTASQTNRLWLEMTGALTATTTAARPSERALLLWQITTDGSGVTATRDRRTWIGRPLHALRAVKGGTLAAGDYTPVLIYPGRSTGYVRPVAGSQWSVGTTGDTSGSTKFDWEVSIAGGAWTSLFPSSGTVDLRTTIAYNASDPTAEGATETLEIPARARLRGKVIAVPGGTASTDLDAVLLVEESGEE